MLQIGRSSKATGGKWRIRALELHKCTPAARCFLSILPQPQAAREAPQARSHIQPQEKERNAA